MGLTADDSLLFDLTKPGIYLKWNNFPLRCVPCASVWMGWERAPYWGWANEVGRWFIWFDFMAETVSELRNKCHGTICQLRGSFLFSVSCGGIRDHGKNKRKTIANEVMVVIFHCGIKTTLGIKLNFPIRNFINIWDRCSVLATHNCARYVMLVRVIGNAQAHDISLGVLLYF